MNNPSKFLKFAIFFAIAYLYVNGYFHNLINSFNPNFQSNNPKVKFSQLVYIPAETSDSGRRLSPDFFDSMTYEEALKIDKPILLFTYTSFCPVSGRIKELIYPISWQYKDSFTFVSLKPAGMSLSVPPDDAINGILGACSTPICVYDHKKNFLMSLNADKNTDETEIRQALDDFLARESKIK